MSLAEADRPARNEPVGLLIGAIVVSLIVGVLLMYSNNAVLAIASGVVYLVGELLLLAPEVAGFSSQRAGRAVGAMAVVVALVLLVLAYGNSG